MVRRRNPESIPLCRKKSGKKSLMVISITDRSLWEKRSRFIQEVRGVRELSFGPDQFLFHHSGWQYGQITGMVVFRYCPIPYGYQSFAVA